MAHNETFANRIRELLAYRADVEEKTMFQGLCFMVDGKLCVCVRNDEILCRLDPETYHPLLEEPGVRQMIHRGKVMQGYVFIDLNALKQANLSKWIGLAIDFNKTAKASSKRKKPKDG